MGKKPKYENNVLVRYTKPTPDVIVPEGITEIGEGAFDNNTFIKTVHLPKSLVYIRDSAFKHCKNLEKINFPDGLLEIGDMAFYSCENLLSLDLPDGLKKIGKDAFQSCLALISVRIPESVEFLAESVFSCCRNLSDVRLPSHLKEIPFHTFFGCYNLRNVSLPSNLRSIGDGAFISTSKLTLRLPESLETIGEHAFSFSRDLTVFFPKNYLEFNTPFAEYSGNFAMFAPRVPFHSLSPKLRFASVLGYAKAPIDLISVFPEKEKENLLAYLRRYRKKFYPLLEQNEDLLSFMIEHHSIPLEETETLLEMLQDSVSCTAALLNYRQTLLTPEAELRLQRREQRAFDRLFSEDPPTLTEMKKEWILEKLENDTLRLCAYKGNASEILVPSRIGKYTVSAIGDYAFSPLRPRSTEERSKHCQDIRSVTIPETVKTIGKHLFQNCFSLESVEITGEITELPESSFLDCPKLNAVKLPDTLKKIGKYAFSDCHELRNLIVPPFVEIIEESAFHSAYQLEEVQLPETLTEISESLFETCIDLKKVNIPSSVRVIRDKAFKNCSRLQSVFLSKNIQMIGKDAFDGTHVRIQTEKGSFAEQYLNDNQISHILQNSFSKDCSRE